MSAFDVQDSCSWAAFHAAPRCLDIRASPAEGDSSFMRSRPSRALRGIGCMAAAMVLSSLTERKVNNATLTYVRLIGFCHGFGIYFVDA